MGSIDTIKLYVEPLLKNLSCTRRWIIQGLFLSKDVLLPGEHNENDFEVLQEASESLLEHVRHLDSVENRRLLKALHSIDILRELQIQPTIVHAKCVCDFKHLFVNAFSLATTLTSCASALIHDCINTGRARPVYCFIRVAGAQGCR